MKKVVFVLLVLFFFIGNVNAQQGKMHAGGQVGISLPMGDFGDGADLGFAFQGNFLYGLNSSIDLSGSIGYISWGTESDQVSFSSVPLTFGGRYYFQRGEFTPYGLAELGLHFFSSTVEFSGFDGFGGGSFSASSTEFGLGIGGGFLYDLKPLKLDINAKINIISDITNLMIMAGLLFPI
jgi:opacity protein-like surface antigen